VYGWIWRRLPGGSGAKAVQAALLAGAVVAALWFAVFPATAGRLPLNQVTVDRSSPASPTGR
jgi:hypothetical protein